MKFGLSVTGRVLAASAIAAACALVSGCSSSPALNPFPSVLADPPPRNDTTLNPDQVKQAMDTLVSERRRLCQEAISEEGSGAPPPDCDAQATTGTTSNAGAPAKP
ncbi:MAG TPA: hypothetical protein VMF12_18315 [Xanthobacteraceae bacterium]|nr:hypothetical protein [Xanthobacteraceae bacterium]